MIILDGVLYPESEEGVSSNILYLLHLHLKNDLKIIIRSFVNIPLQLQVWKFDWRTLCIKQQLHHRPIL